MLSRFVMLLALACSCLAQAQTTPTPPPPKTGPFTLTWDASPGWDNETAYAADEKVTYEIRGKEQANTVGCESYTILPVLGTTADTKFVRPAVRLGAHFCYQVITIINETVRALPTAFPYDTPAPPKTPKGATNVRMTPGAG